jgi:hypothetical protein
MARYTLPAPIAIDKNIRKAIPHREFSVITTPPLVDMQNQLHGREQGTAAHTAVPRRHLWGIPVVVIPGVATDSSK